MAADFDIASDPSPDTPQAAGMRFTPIHGGVAIEFFDCSGEPIAYGILGGAKLAQAKEKFDAATAMAQATTGEGLAGMAPEGTA